jgi:hypothetical protein
MNFFIFVSPIGALHETMLQQKAGCLDGCGLHGVRAGFRRRKPETRPDLCHSPLFYGVRYGVAETMVIGIQD